MLFAVKSLDSDPYPVFWFDPIALDAYATFLWTPAQVCTFPVTSPPFTNSIAMSHLHCSCQKGPEHRRAHQAQWQAADKATNGTDSWAFLSFQHFSRVAILPRSLSSMKRMSRQGSWMRRICSGTFPGVLSLQWSYFARFLILHLANLGYVQLLLVLYVLVFYGLLTLRCRWAGLMVF